jgi:hypothetical protein
LYRFLAIAVLLDVKDIPQVGPLQWGRITYATGPGLAYYESGYLPSADFWRLATIFGFIFLGALLAIGVPILLAR